jgi:hypothetical protein
MYFFFKATSSCNVSYSHFLLSSLQSQLPIPIPPVIPRRAFPPFTKKSPPPPPP